MFPVLRIRDVYPGSEYFFHPGSRVEKTLDPDPYQRIEVFFTQKILLSAGEI
jgi:hypothetical protein